MINQTVDIEKLKYFREFEAFKLPEQSNSKKKNVKIDIINQIRDRGI